MMKWTILHFAERKNEGKQNAVYRKMFTLLLNDMHKK